MPRYFETIQPIDEKTAEGIIEAVEQHKLELPAPKKADHVEARERAAASLALAAAKKLAGALLFGLLLAGTVEARPIQISWTPGVGGTPASTFHVERKMDTSTACTEVAPAFVQIATVPASQATYADSTVTVGTVYCYRVRASNVWGFSGYTNTAGLMAPGDPPNAPTSIMLGAVGPPPQIPMLSLYVDPTAVSDVWWPQHSHYRQPWRAWSDTVPATALRDGVGINVSWYRAETNIPAEFAALAASGITRARIEIGWNLLTYPSNLLLGTLRTRLLDMLAQAKLRGIRPLILLNANHGVPNPESRLTRTVATGAAAGARTVRLNNVTGLTVGRSGFSFLSGDPHGPEILFTAINPSSRIVTLAKPLPVALAVNRVVTIHTLLAPPLFEPGSPQFEATATAWLAYAREVNAAVRSAGLAAWDVEFWNELTFGSDYLNHAWYYSPPLMPEGPLIGKTSRTWELLRRTQAMLAAEFPEVTLVNGLSNTWFFGVNVADLPPGVQGQSYHPYMVINYVSVADEQCCPGPSTDGLFYNLEGYAPPAPPYRVLMPEAALTFIKTESLTRFTNPLDRLAHPPGVVTFQHYITEHGFHPGEWGVTDAAVGEGLKAKAALRSAVAFIHTGITGLYFFSDHDDNPLGFGFLNADESPTKMAQALGRLRALVAAAEPVATPTPIALEIALTPDDLVFPGDATFPPLKQSAILAVFPFQVNARAYLIPVYVMTRNILVPHPGALATVVLTGIAGVGATVTATDPLDGAAIPVEVLAATSGSLTVRLPVTDSPRLLHVQAA